MTFVVNFLNLSGQCFNLFQFDDSKVLINSNKVGLKKYYVSFCPNVIVHFGAFME